MSKILIIDDDVELCELLEEFLIGENFQINIANNGLDGLGSIKDDQPDLIIMDVMMPKMNGFDTLRKLRADNSVLPVIMLTARGDDIDKILGLELGADDYLAKPFNPRELSARIRAILRRSSSNELASSESYQVEDIRIRPASRQAYIEDNEVELTSVEFELLNLILKSAGEVCTKKSLTEQGLSKKLVMYDRSIDMHISNLRKKIGDKADGSMRIKTVRGIGYIYPLS